MLISLNVRNWKIIFWTCSLHIICIYAIKNPKRTKSIQFTIYWIFAHFFCIFFLPFFFVGTDIRISNIPTSCADTKQQKKKKNFTDTKKEAKNSKKKNGLFNSSHFIAFVCISLKTCDPFDSLLLKLFYLFILFYFVFLAKISIVLVVVYSARVYSSRCVVYNIQHTEHRTVNTIAIV